MTDLQIFGFGSLVNPKTHSYDVLGISTAENQIREWVTRPDHPVAFLSLASQPGSAVAGLVLRVPADQVAALDEREAGYTKHDLTPDLLPRPADPVYTYRGADTVTDTSKPILLSYLDCVIQGFCRHIDTDAAIAFFDSTRAWDRPILDDRAAPKYPRAVDLTQPEVDLVDHHIAKLGLNRISADGVGF